MEVSLLWRFPYYGGFLIMEVKQYTNGTEISVLNIEVSLLWRSNNTLI